MTQVNEQETASSVPTASQSAKRPPRSPKRAEGGTAVKSEAPAQPAVASVHDEGTLFVGIDLGTSRTSISASNGARHTVLSCVGYCKDVIGERRLGKRMLVGEEALENRLALDLVRPLKSGVVDVDDARSLAAVQELLGHAIALCEPKPGQSISAVIGAPARASIDSQKTILQAVDPLVSSAMIVSEPFAVAYGLNVLTEALIIDIGAGTTDLCRMHGTMPEEADQITLSVGGDAVDEQLEQAILKRYPKVQLTRNMLRRIKEKYGFVRDPHQTCEVTLTEMGRPKAYDITEPLRIACHSVVPHIVEAIYKLIGTFDPEFQAKLRGNVILAGGGSRLSGLPLLIEKDLKGLGGGSVVAVEEPTYAGSNGGLKLAMEMPARYWKALA
ncbi:MAG: MamK family actin-like protein [Phycisphaerae bacterium]